MVELGAAGEASQGVEEIAQHSFGSGTLQSWVSGPSGFLVANSWCLSEHMQHSSLPVPASTCMISGPQSETSIQDIHHTNDMADVAPASVYIPWQWKIPEVLPSDSLFCCERFGFPIAMFDCLRHVVWPATMWAPSLSPSSHDCFIDSPLHTEPYQTSFCVTSNSKSNSKGHKVILPTFLKKCAYNCEYCACECLQLNRSVPLYTHTHTHNLNIYHIHLYICTSIHLYIYTYSYTINYIYIIYHLL